MSTWLRDLQRLKHQDSRPQWIKRIRKGDVLARGTVFRIVRDVKHTDKHTFVIFLIRRCSWTTRCYTVYTQHDLKSLGFRPTGKRKRLRSHFDYEIEQNFDVSLRDTTLHCCDVEGLA